MEQISQFVSVVIERLKTHYPVVNTQLDHASAFELLIATILSAQCTDGQVNKVTKELFARYPDPRALAGANLDDIKKIIFSTGFYNNKAKNIKACSHKIQNEFNGKVPRDIKALTSLPGVGRKTANVVRSVCFNFPTIVVDTHVLRVSGRLGLTDKKDPVKVEFELMDVLPRSVWNDIGLQFIYLGRRICHARKPACDRCFLNDLCPSVTSV
ncbi:endonuclease III [uncultured Desulfobacter sp.]|uniref:endonuclease III n=1 Tax=uncultured Desulfobacter sp. TaxID=240139 RepID=UPI002AAC2056|nr:endonuclease III [uncultured Desulfobacter sp.]